MFFLFRGKYVDNLQEAYEVKHNLGEGNKIPKEEFQKLLQKFLFFIFGVPSFAVFLKNRIALTSIPNDLFIPAVTSATAFLLAKLNKI
ncbi:unnamed protein product [Brassica rapa]|uniref:Uncharacterized protein n=2 Tax=Brassica TaxID=3705 RepID=A0A3P5Z5U5_BRACM|nr:unnamed protein product [Brassica napus]CAG7873696.1 unnamed protein product [Brassica rapa]VDC69493.1 unnamed protein product [Brassica rapa]